MSETVYSDFISKVFEEVKLELNDPDFSTRQHGHTPTYTAGCRGPLCRRYERNRQRKVYLERHPDVRKTPRFKTQLLDAAIEHALRTLQA